MEQQFKFNYRQFNNDGFNTENGLFFMDFIRSCERTFYENHHPFHPNYLFGNNSTMLLIKKCMDDEPDTDYGMDLIKGKVDLDTNLEIETYCKRETIYGISSESDEDEPLYLIKDDETFDGRIVLKYIPDNEDEDGEEFIPMPIFLSFTPSIN